MTDEFKAALELIRDLCYEHRHCNECPLYFPSISSECFTRYHMPQAWDIKELEAYHADDEDEADEE